MAIDLLPSVSPPSRWRRWWAAQQREEPAMPGEALPPNPTPDRLLQHALEADDPESARSALMRGADPSQLVPHFADLHRQKHDSWTLSAVRRRRFEVALLCHAYDVACNPGHRRKQATALARQLAQSEPSGSEDTPAARRAQHQLALAVFPHAEPDAQALLYAAAARSPVSDGLNLFVDLLALAGGPVTTARSRRDTFPLDNLFRNGNAEGVRALLPHLPPDAFVQQWGHLKAATLLLAAVKNGMTALIDDVLALPHHPTSLDMLDVEGQGETALMLLLRARQFEAAKRLLEAGAAGQTQDFSSENALHHLARALDRENQVAQLPLWRRLVAAGASTEAVNGDGLTPDELCRARGMSAMEEAGARALCSTLTEALPAASPSAAKRRRM